MTKAKTAVASSRVAAQPSQSFRPSKVRKVSWTQTRKARKISPLTALRKMLPQLRPTRMISGTFAISRGALGEGANGASRAGASALAAASAFGASAFGAGSPPGGAWTRAVETGASPGAGFGGGGGASIKRGSSRVKATGGLPLGGAPFMTVCHRSESSKLDRAGYAGGARFARIQGRSASAAENG